MAKTGSSVAPRERINIKYTTEAGGVAVEKELPLHLLVTGDFTGKVQDVALDERQTVAVDKDNFNAVMSNAGIELEFAVANRLEEVKEGEVSSELPVKIKVDSLQDLSPDNIARAVPELNKLLALRESLVALKGPLGNKPAFRAQLKSILEDDKSREQLLKELEVITAKDK